MSNQNKNGGRPSGSRGKGGAPQRKVDAEDAKIVSETDATEVASADAQAAPTGEKAAPTGEKAAPNGEKAAPTEEKAAPTETEPETSSASRAPGDASQNPKQDPKQEATPDAAPERAAKTPSAADAAGPSIAAAARVAATRGRAQADADAEQRAQNTGGAQASTERAGASAGFIEGLGLGRNESLIYAVGGAVVGGLIVLLGGALVGGGSTQTDYAQQISALETRIETLGAGDASALADRVTMVEGRLSDLGGDAETAASSALAASSNATAALDRADEINAQIEALSGRIDAVAGDVQSVSRELTAVVEAAPAGADGEPAAAATALLRERIDQLEGRIETMGRDFSAARAAEGDAERLAALQGVDETMQGSIDELGYAVSEQGAAIGGLQTSDEALNNRIDELDLAISEQTALINGLLARIEAQEAAAGPALAVAVALLDGELDAGRPFTDTLAEIEAQSAAPVPEELRAAAEAGVASPSELAARFDRASRSALRAASRGQAADGDALDRLGGLIVHRRRDATQGDAPDAVLNRAKALVDDGDIAAAVAEVEGMQEPALSYALRAPEMAAWLADARARIDAQAALESWRATLLSDLRN